MAFENKLAAVSPQAFTADGTSLGIVTIADTTGFYIKQKVNLQSDSLQQTLLQVKNVLSSTQLIIGPNNNSLTASPKNYTDLSAFTVADNATISAPEQNNFPIPADDHYNSVYLPAPVAADRIVNVDPHGNFYNYANTYPINIIPQSQIPFSLGALMFPALISNLLTGLTYDEVQSDTVGNEEILTFYSGGSQLLEVTLTKTSDGWILNLGTSLDNFLLLEDGALIELENGTGAILLE
jgi:hypothetical protein